MNPAQQQTEEPAQTPANVLAILNGGETITVTKLDGSQEEVKVLKVSQRNMEKLSIAWLHEGLEIELYCDKPKGWSETLSEESWEAVMERGRSLNEAPFARYAARRNAGFNALGSSVTKLVAAAAEKAIATATSKLTSS